MSKIKVIFHIGMGKTGTTSIQYSLGHNKDRLAAEGVCYLGMWLDMIEPEFFGLDGISAFISRPLEYRMQAAAEFRKYVMDLHEKTKATTFIFSNEALGERPNGIIPFLKSLMVNDDLDVLAIAYVRNPAPWLDSAYSQWGLKHKTVQGPIRPFANMAEPLLRQYDSLIKFHMQLKERCIVRHYDAIVDVVADFYQQCGVSADMPTERKLVRDELAELVMRREFNNLFSDSMLPSEFEATMWRGRQMKAPKLGEILESTFDKNAAASAIEKTKGTFDYLKSELGIDLDFSFRDRPPTDVAEVRDRIVDYLLAITVRLAARVRELEQDRGGETTGK